MSKEKVFLGEETKQQMVKNQELMNNYTLDAFDNVFTNLNDIKEDNKKNTEKIIGMIPKCEKTSVWRHIKVQWGVLIAIFVTLITVYIIK